MKRINVNAVICCSASYCRGQVIGQYCKKIYKGFSGLIITEWHRVLPYEVITMLPAIECETIVLQPKQHEVNESLWS